MLEDMFDRNEYICGVSTADISLIPRGGGGGGGGGGGERSDPTWPVCVSSCSANRDGLKYAFEQSGMGTSESALGTGRRSGRSSRK